jgi:hypothetical protein
MLKRSYYYENDNNNNLFYIYLSVRESNKRYN